MKILKKGKEKLFQRIGNMKIALKIMLCMFSIDIMLTIFICIFTGRYFNKLYYDEVELQMQDTMNVISQSLTTLNDTLMNNIVSFAATPAIQRVVSDSGKGLTFQDRDAVQLQLTRLMGNSLIDSAFLVNRDGAYYTMYSYVVRPEQDLSHFLDSYGDIRTIKWFPNCKNPFLHRQQDVIPVVIPLSTLPPNSNVVVSGEGREADTKLVVLLNLKKFQDRLSLSNTGYFERTYFVVNKDGQNISLKHEDTMKPIMESPDFLAGVKANTGDLALHRITEFKNSMVYSWRLPFSELQLISVLSKDSLNSKIAAMNRFIILMGAAGLVFSVLFSILLSRFVTAPLKRLMLNIREIQEKRYDRHYQMKYTDEIGQLNKAVNSMYDTIQSQIRQIKDDEHEKYQMEIQLLAEQINPHLLYNTLEGINLEVLNNHTLIASSMINNLGKFMRIGLNYGEELILIEHEIAHVGAYINIMNHRLNKGIVFSWKVDEKLKNHNILKLILQPLVENSIKHGFREENWGEAVCIPAIDVGFHKTDGGIRIEVSDNGCGIDVERAKNAVYRQEEKGERHVGLHNVYARLKIYYGGADVEFETIPYFKNTLIIAVPEKSES